MRTRILGMAAALIAAWGVLVQAGPVQFKDVSADALWLAHVDVDAMRSSVVIEKTYDACIKGGKLADCLDKMAKKCGMDPRKDLHAVTLYGNKIARDHGVLIVRADMNRDLLRKKVEKAPGHRKVKHQEYEIHAWKHKKGGEKKEVAGALYQSDVLVMASSVELLETALDVLDGRKESLKPGKKPLAREVPDGAMFLARAMEINKSSMAKKHPLCSQLTRLDYAEGENEEQWSGHLTLTAENREVADRLETALKGFRSMCWLHLDGAPKLQQLLDQVKIDQDERAVEAKFEAPVEKVASAMAEACELVKKHMAKHGAMEKCPKKRKSCPTKSDKKESAKKAPMEKKQDKKAEKKQEKEVKAEAPEKKSAEKPARGMREPTARQGTPVLGVVIGKPLGKQAAEVVRVWEDSPAAKAGLEPGDRIVKVGKQEIRSPGQLRSTVLKHKPGDKVTLVVERGDERKELEVKLAGGDDFAGWSPRGRMHRFLSPRPWLGVQIGSDSERGVSVLGVLPGSPADRAGLKKGDVILRVGKTRVEAPADLQARIAGHKPGATAHLVILRDEERKNVEVELGAIGIWEGELDNESRQLLKRFLEDRFPFSEDIHGEWEKAPSEEMQ